MAAVKCSLKFYETDKRITYSLYVGGLRALYGEIDKRPGWKQVWRDIHAILKDLMKDIESGTGLQSRTFQQSLSTESRYIPQKP